MKDQEILVSVIITCYNKERYIEKAINSVLDQRTDFKYEIIVIDDCSTDGSWKIIKNLCSSNASNIKAFRNSKNIGITKTWIKVCKKANGKYIARLDGDDYWTNHYKLNKQTQVLETSKTSQWICSDFDMVDEYDSIKYKNCILNNKVPYTENAEELLVKKGFTNPSSWLVNTKLMLKVNSLINKSAVDDTFNIQLELFQVTKLSLLKDSTNVYRVLQQSDSTLTSNRINGLLKTQIEYINKNQCLDTRKMLRTSLEEYAKLQITNLEKDKLIIEQEAIMKDRLQQIQDMKNSKTWKLGSLITKPLHKIFKNKG